MGVGVDSGEAIFRHFEVERDVGYRRLKQVHD